MATTEVIFHNKLTSATNSWTKSSIPNTYAHLILKASLVSDNSSNTSTFHVQVNSSTSGYDRQSLRMNSSGWAASNASNQGSWLQHYIMAANNNGIDSGAGFSTWEMLIPNYSGSTLTALATATCSTNGNTSTAWQWEGSVDSYGWRSTDAIHTIQVSCDAGDFAEHSCLTIYGVND